jgi:hypothetical protein
MVQKPLPYLLARKNLILYCHYPRGYFFGSYFNLEGVVAAILRKCPKFLSIGSLGEL